MNRAGLVALAMLAALAGCLDAGDDGSTEGNGTAASDTNADAGAGAGRVHSTPSRDSGGPANQTWRLLEGSFTTSLDQVQTGPVDFSDGAGGGNCIHYWPDDVAAVRSGTFEAAWDSTSPLHDRLRIAVRDGVDLLGSVGGPSPLRVEFEREAIQSEAGLAMFITTEMDQGVIYDQTIELSWTLSYQGVEAPTFEPHSICD